MESGESFESLALLLVFVGNICDGYCCLALTARESFMSPFPGSFFLAAGNYAGLSCDIRPTESALAGTKLLGIVLSHLPENEPYVLIAESFSGPIALRASWLCILSHLSLWSCVHLSPSALCRVL